MTVTIHINNSYSVPPPAINKQGIEYKNKHNIAKKDVCYKYSRGKSTGYVLNPKIDFLVISLPLENLEDAEYSSWADSSTDPKVHAALIAEKAIAEFLLTNLKSKEKLHWTYFNKSDLPKKGQTFYQHFKVGCRLSDLPGLAVIQVGANIELTGKNKNPPPKLKKLKVGMRLTIIPSEWTNSDINKFWDALASISLLQITREFVAKYGRITRVDWAVDFINVGTEDLLLEKVETTRKSIIYTGRHGGIETQYVGPNKNKKIRKNYNAYIYNKLKKTNKDLAPQDKGELLRARFEVRHTPHASKKQSWNLQGLAKPSGKKKNVFEKYNIIDFFAARPEGAGIMWHMFGDSCRLRSVPDALEMLYDDIRGAYKAKLIEASEECWKPLDLWGAIHNHVKFLLGAGSHLTITKKHGTGG